MSAELAALLRRSTGTYTARAVEYSRRQFATEPRPEILALHTKYWDTLVRAAETWDFEELVVDARATGLSQAARGVTLTESVNRAVAATNTIELAILETNDGTFPSHDAIVALAEIRTTIAMAVAEGYERARDAAPAPTRGGTTGSAVGRVRATAAALGVRAIVHDLALGEALPTHGAEETALCVVESGDVRLSTHVGGERVVSLFTVGSDGAFFRFGDAGRSHAPIVAEALNPARILILEGEALARVTAAEPEAVVTLVARFTRRTSESQALIDGLIRKSVAMRLYNALLHLSAGHPHARTVPARSRSRTTRWPRRSARAASPSRGSSASSARAGSSRCRGIPRFASATPRNCSVGSTPRSTTNKSPLPRRGTSRRARYFPRMHHRTPSIV